MNERERLETYAAMCREIERVQAVIASALADVITTPTVLRRALLRQAVQLSLNDARALEDITATLTQLQAALREAAEQHMTVAEVLNRLAAAAVPSSSGSVN